MMVSRPAQASAVAGNEPRHANLYETKNETGQALCPARVGSRRAAASLATEAD